MGQLLTTEVTIIEQSIKAYVRDFLKKNPEIETDLSESMGIGKFLDKLKKDPKMVESFTIFLAEEQV